MRDAGVGRRQQRQAVDVLLWAVDHPDVWVGVRRRDLRRGVDGARQHKLPVRNRVRVRGVAGGRQRASMSHMLDWPLQRITSPNRTLSRLVCSPPLLMAMEAGASDAGCAGSSTFHRPSAPAVALCVVPRKETETFAPAVCQPQMGAGRPRCSTLPRPAPRRSSWTVGRGGGWGRAHVGAQGVADAQAGLGDGEQRCAQQREKRHRAAPVPPPAPALGSASSVQLTLDRSQAQRVCMS